MKEDREFRWRLRMFVYGFVMATILSMTVGSCKSVEITQTGREEAGAWKYLGQEVWYRRFVVSTDDPFSNKGCVVVKLQTTGGGVSVDCQ